MITLDLAEIEALIDRAAMAPKVAQALIAASEGRVNLPPVGHITFEDDADCHIKYGHIRGGDRFVIKVATGFPANGALGLPTGNGLSLVLSAKTGGVEAILHDQMRLTDVRTGLAGALASHGLARRDARNVLVVGTGLQAVEQILAHQTVFARDLRFSIWGRDAGKAQKIAQNLGVTHAADLENAVRQADIVVTATGARAPIVQSAWVADGTHITAVGADAPGKQEIEVELLGRCQRVAVDSHSQCVDHGEVCHAITQALLAESDLVELGQILNGTQKGRTHKNDITLADLTGIAAQDIAIAEAVLDAHAAR